MKKLILILVASSMLLFSNCDKVADATGVCAKKWISAKTLTGSTATATVNNGALLLSAPNLKAGINITVNQASVSGDFEAEATFEDFTPGVQADITSSFFQFVAIPMDQSQIANTAISNITGALASSIFASAENDPKPFANKEGNLSGTVKLKRVGSTFTITTIVNSKSMLDGSTVQSVSTATKTDFGTTNLNIGFQLGALQDVNKSIQVKITNFKITGGGALVSSDSFDCNSLL